MLSKIWLSKPHLSNEEDVYIVEALKSNWITTLGHNIDNFELELENYIDSNKHVAVLNSGTSGIHLALILSGVKENDEVLCQSFTFSGSVFPVKYLGAKPIFIDSEPETWNLCPKLLERVIIDKISKNKKPKAIIFVHTYGMPAKIDAIVAIAKKYSISLIEDTAEALGSSYNGEKCGTFGDFGIFSFNGNKIITTSSGGAIICKSQEIKERAIKIASQAKENVKNYEHNVVGYNYRMSNILAGLGRGQLKVIDKRVLQRRKVNQFYQDLFKDVDGVEVFKESNSNYYSNHWLTCLLIDKSKSKLNVHELYEHLRKDKIESRPLWKPLHLQPVFKDCEYYGEDRISEKLFENGLCLPSSSSLSVVELDRISKSIKTIIKLKTQKY